MSSAPEEAREFAAAFRSFLEWVHSTASVGSSGEVVARLRAHLGPDRVQRSVVTRELPPYEQVNLQVALNAWSAEPGRAVTVLGVAIPPHFAGVTAQQMLSGDGLPPLRLSAPDLVDLPSGPGTTLACLQTGVLLVEDALGASLLLVRGPERHQPPSLTGGCRARCCRRAAGSREARRAAVRPERVPRSAAGARPGPAGRPPARLRHAARNAPRGRGAARGRAAPCRAAHGRDRWVPGVKRCCRPAPAEISAVQNRLFRATCQCCHGGVVAAVSVPARCGSRLAFGR